MSAMEMRAASVTGTLSSVNVRGPIGVNVLKAHDETLLDIAKDQSKWTQTNPLLLGDTLVALTDAIFQLLGGLFSPPSMNTNWQGMTTDGTAAQTQQAQIDALAKLYLEETKDKVTGFYKIDPVIDLLLNGRGTEGTDGYLGKLVTSNFTFNNAIPKSCLLVICAPSEWTAGTFSQAFKAYTSTTSSRFSMNSSCDLRLTTMVNHLRISFWPKNSSSTSTSVAFTAKS